MTPLQSWLLLIAVIAVLLLVTIIFVAIVETVAFALEIWRVRRAARRRSLAHKRWLNSVYGKSARRNGHEVYIGSARWVARQSGYLPPEPPNETKGVGE